MTNDPRWLTILQIVVIVLVVALGVMLVVGGLLRDSHTTVVITHCSLTPSSTLPLCP